MRVIFLEFQHNSKFTFNMSKIGLFFDFLEEAATRGVLWKKLFLKFHKIHWKTHMLEFLFNDAGLHICNFI